MESLVKLTRDNLDQLDFKEGAVVLLDKPMGWTSFDVVNKIRFAFKHHLGLKKFKVGHAGTLDPLATGLLIVCIGKYTKLIDTIQGMRKEYTATMKLGGTTPTYDAESEVDASFPFDHITSDLLNKTAVKFTGQIDQMPPIYSALKINGQAAYKLARRGEKVVLKSRMIEIYSLDMQRIELPEVEFSVACSKGTYIRSLAHDMGKEMDSGSHLTALRRTSIGSYSVEGSWQVLELCDRVNALKRQSSNL